MNYFFEWRPATLEDVISMLRESLGPNYNCSLQYKDPEFNYELCNLTDVADLPEKTTVKVIPVLELVPVPTSDEILSTSSLVWQRLWPRFDIPNFSVSVTYRLWQADLLFLPDGTHLKVSKELKHEILERPAENMYRYTAYPNNVQFESTDKQAPLSLGAWLNQSP